MNPGDLRYEITILDPAPVRLADGSMGKQTPTEVMTIRAAYHDGPSREFFGSQITHTEATCWWQIRYVDGIRSTHQVQFGTHVFELVAPPADPTMRGRELQLHCKEIDASG